MMAQLLDKYSVRAGASSIKLMKVIKNDFEKVLPVDVRKIGTSTKSKSVDLDTYIQSYYE